MDLNIYLDLFAIWKLAIKVFWLADSKYFPIFASGQFVSCLEEWMNLIIEVCEPIRDS